MKTYREQQHETILNYSFSDWLQTKLMDNDESAESFMNWFSIKPDVFESWINRDELPPDYFIEKFIDYFGDMEKYKSPVFDDLPQYALDRKVFCDIYERTTFYFYEYNNAEGDEFKFWYHSDEFYILHKPSGILVNWYKHCGRTNTCNKELTLDEHRQFVKMFLEEMEWLLK